MTDLAPRFGRASPRMWQVGVVVSGLLVLVTATVLWSELAGGPSTLAIDKMRIDEASATQVAKRLITNPPPAALCETSPSDLAAVTDVMKATAVCLYGSNPSWSKEVVFKGGIVSAPGVPGDHVTTGLLYSTFRGLPRVFDMCVRHLLGPWWAYEQLILECPAAYTGIGAA
jgi:hypothetical protein